MPAADQADKAHIARLSTEAQAAAQARRDEFNRFGHSVLRDLAPGGLGGGARLAAAWEQSIPDFAEFSTELTKRFKRSLSLGERNDWENALDEARERVAAYCATVARCEQQIDAVVYRLFGLSEAEVRLIEAF